MSDQTTFEARLADAYVRYVAAAPVDVDSRMVAATVEIAHDAVATGMRRRWPGWLDRPTRPRGDGWNGYARVPLLRQLLAAAAVVVIAVAVIALGGRFGLIGQTGTTPSPSSSPSAMATPGTSDQPTVGPSVAPSRPAGSTPPLSTSAWTGLTVTALSTAPYGDVPQNPSLVVRWAGGYVVVTAWRWEDGAMPVWESPDGRTWTERPTSLFGLQDPSTYTSGTACGDKVIVETGVTTPAGVTVSRWSSSDGTTWTQTPLHNEGFGQLAGWGQVAVAAVDKGESAASGMALDVTTDCSTWQRVALPGPAVGQITNVTASGGGFVAVGYSGPPTSTGSEPLAWWSNDGLHWSAAKVSAGTGHRFMQIWAGSGGYLGTVTSVGTTPAQETLLVSTDGHSWAPTTSDPLGMIQAGEGVGSPAGSFDGDGTRLLAYGTPGGTPPDGLDAYQYWVSSDGTHWTWLTLTGSGRLPLPARATPALQGG